MRIVIFSALYKPSIGGVENYTEQMAEALAKLGNSVTIVTHRIDDSPTYVDDKYASIIRLPSIALLNGRLPIPKKNREFSQLISSIKDSPCDAILINTRFYPLSLIGADIARARGITPIVLEHGSAHLTLGNQIVDTLINLYEHAITSLLKQSRPVFYGVSSASCRWLKHFNISAKGILPNAIDVDRWLDQVSSRNYRYEYPALGNAPIVSFVGRLVPEKGIWPLVEAMSILDDSGCKAKLLVAGNGPMRAELEASSGENIIFLGTLSKADVGALLLQSDLFCLPSRSEGFATSLLEASASSTPALITRVGGVEELIPAEEYGWILPSTNPAIIAEALSRALSSSDQLKIKGENVKSLVEKNFSWTATAQKLISAFRALQP